jgi:hypothetical protein
MLRALRGDVALLNAPVENPTNGASLDARAVQDSIEPRATPEERTIIFVATFLPSSPVQSTRAV